MTAKKTPPLFGTRRAEELVEGKNAAQLAGLRRMFAFDGLGQEEMRALIGQRSKWTVHRWEKAWTADASSAVAYKVEAYQRALIIALAAMDRDAVLTRLNQAVSA